MKPQEIIERASYLKRMHDDALIDRSRFRAILKGGEDGMCTMSLLVNMVWANIGGE